MPKEPRRVTRRRTGMTPTLGSAPHARQMVAVTAAGAFLVLVAVVLYLSGLSRATAVVLFLYALCLVGAASFAWRSGRWPHRTWVVIFAVLAVAGLAYGVGLFIYGQSHAPVSV